MKALSSIGVKSFLCMDKLVQIGVFLCGALTFAFPKGYSYGPAVLLLLSVVSLFGYREQHNIGLYAKVLSCIFISFFIVQAISVLFDGGQIRELDRPSRMLMGLPILLLFARYKPKVGYVFFGLAIGSITAGLKGFNEKVVLGFHRAFGDGGQPIQYGNISMTMGLLCICGYFWYKKNKNIKFAYFMLFSSAMGMLGSLLSGTRGGWVLLPIILITIIIKFKDVISRQEKTIVFAFFVAFGSLIFLPQTGILKRITDAHSNVITYYTGVDKDTSLGLRFQLWSASLEAFRQRPLFGWGNNSVNEFYKKEFDNGNLTLLGLKTSETHAHNQILDEMAKRGLPGLISLAFFLCYPIFLFYKHTSGGIKFILLGICGMTLFDYSLSQAFINHNSGITFFCCMFSILISINEDEIAALEK
ncbi:MAG: O-antigen ligase family protein [Aeromonas sp.]